MALRRVRLAVRRGEMFAALSLLFVSSLTAQTARLVSYKAEVVFSSMRQASVSATFRVDSQGVTAPLRVTMVRYPGLRLDAALLRQTSGRAASAAFREEPAAFKASLADLTSSREKQSGTYSVTYTVSSEAELTRIPLPIPTASPVSIRRPVEIRVSLPAGRILAGDSFPLLTAEGPNGGFARVVAVPSVLQLQSSASNAISLEDWIFNPATLTTLAMILLLGAGSFIWYRNSRSV